MLEGTCEVLPAGAGVSQLAALKERLEPLYSRLGDHRLYRSFRSIEDVRRFMETHVFAVWDFMSLLKTLQVGLTSVTVPWLPVADSATCRLVNEIVLGEESDLLEGRAASHFEIYLKAMHACGASAAVMETALGEVRRGVQPEDALRVAGAPQAARSFVSETFKVIGSGRLHAIAAAFTFGREDLIPDVFRGFIRDQDARLGGRLNLFRWYLDRHIEVDGDEHGPMSLQMVRNLCGEDAQKWTEAEEAAVGAVEARLNLWDAIAVELAI